MKETHYKNGKRLRLIPLILAAEVTEKSDRRKDLVVEEETQE